MVLGSLGPCEHRFPCSTGLHWIPGGLSRSPSTLDYLHPPWHWVPSRDLLPDWLLCMITAMKAQAVAGCLWKILPEPGLQLVVSAFLPTKAELCLAVLAPCLLLLLLQLALDWLSFERSCWDHRSCDWLLPAPLPPGPTNASASLPSGSSCWLHSLQSREDPAQQLPTLTPTEPPTGAPHTRDPEELRGRARPRRCCMGRRAGWERGWACRQPPAPGDGKGCCPLCSPSADAGFHIAGFSDLAGTGG